MLEFSAAPSSRRTAKRILSITFGLILLYAALYFWTIPRTVPAVGPAADRYLSRVQHEDWRAVRNAHLGGTGDAAVAEWQRVRQDYGPIVSYHSDSSRNITVPLYTRSRLDYEIVCDKGTLRAELTLEPSSGGWRVQNVRPYFRPPAPFDSMGGNTTTGAISGPPASHSRP